MKLLRSIHGQYVTQKTKFKVEVQPGRILAFEQPILTMTNADNNGVITIRSQLFRKTLEVIEEEESLENANSPDAEDVGEVDGAETEVEGKEFLEDEIDGGLQDGGLYYFESSRYFNHRIAKWHGGWDWDTGTFNSADINEDQIWKLRKDEETGAWFIFNHRFKDSRLAMWGTNAMTDPTFFQTNSRESGTKGADDRLEERQLWRLEQQDDGLYTIENVAHPGHFWIKWGPHDKQSGAAYIGTDANWGWCHLQGDDCERCNEKGCHKWHLRSIFDGVAVEWREIFSYNNTGHDDTSVEVSFIHGVTSEYEFASTSELAATLAASMNERKKEKHLRTVFNQFN